MAALVASLAVVVPSVVPSVAPADAGPRDAGPPDAPAPVEEAPAPGGPPRRDAPGAREYVVQVDDPGELAAVVATVADEDAVVTRAWNGPVAGLTAVLTDREAAVLAAAPGVATVDENVVFEAQGTQTDPGWNLDRIDQRAGDLDGRYLYRGDGAGVDVYVIDSGVRSTHADLGGRVATGYVAPGLPDAADCSGHGTHVAGVVAGARYGVAKGARVVPVKVLDCPDETPEGGGSLSTLVEGINWVVRDHRPGRPAVANLSLGCPCPGALDNAIDAMIADGITVVVAAGNAAGDACGFSPADARAAITVGASTSTDGVATFSNDGPCVDVFAPGVGVRSAGGAGDGASVVRSGTSAAAPHLSGAAAVVLGRAPGLSPAQVWSRLRADSTVGALRGGSPDRLVHMAVPTCGGRRPTWLGTPDADTVRGTAGRDVIVAQGGDDTIRGRGGDDVICAGAGSDTVGGGPGADVVRGQQGRDTLRGGGGADRLVGNGGPDGLVGGRGDDRIHGARGRDLLLGRGGSDRLFGGAQRDVCRGGGGRDRAVSCEVRRGIP